MNYIPTTALFDRLKAQRPPNNDQFIWVKCRGVTIAELNHEGILRFTPNAKRWANQSEILDNICVLAKGGDPWLQVLDLTGEGSVLLPLLSRPIDSWRFQCYAKADSGAYWGVAPVEEVNGVYAPVTPTYNVRSQTKTKGNAIRKQVKDFTDWLETTITLADGKLDGSIVSPYITKHQEFYCIHTHQQGDDVIRTPHYNQYELLTHRFTVPLNPDKRDMSYLTTTGKFGKASISVANHGTPEQLDSLACIFRHKVGNVLTTRSLFNILTHPDLLEVHDLKLKFVFLLHEAMMSGRWHVNKSFKDSVDRDNARVSTDRYFMVLNIGSVKSFINRELITPHKGEEDVIIRTVKADRSMRTYISY